MTLLWLAILLPLAGAALALAVREAKAPAALAASGALSSALVLGLGLASALGRVHLLATFGRLPVLGPLEVGLDPLSGVLMATAGAVFLAVSLASPGYLSRYLGRYTLRGYSAGFHLLLLATVLVLVARDLVTFFVAWEVMSVLAYLLVAYEHRRDGTEGAALHMLAAGEVGTMAALVGLLLLAAHAGGASFAALAAGARGVPDGVRWPPSCSPSSASASRPASSLAWAGCRAPTRRRRPPPRRCSPASS